MYKHGKRIQAKKKIKPKKNISRIYFKKSLGGEKGDPGDDKVFYTSETLFKIPARPAGPSPLSASLWIKAPTELEPPATWEPISF